MANGCPFTQSLGGEKLNSKIFLISILLDKRRLNMYQFENPTGSYVIELLNQLLEESDNEEFETEEEIQEFIKDFLDENIS